jgi:predicted nucleic acid-binding protein
MAKIILTDTCFWLGLVDNTDQYHESSMAIAELIEGYDLILPWPCLYETVSTHLTRRRDRLILFEEIVSKPNMIFLEDAAYKSEALRQVFYINRITGRAFSLTDGVIREILKDIDVRINYLVTYNVVDFKDICDERGVEIISN